MGKTNKISTVAALKRSLAMWQRVAAERAATIMAERDEARAESLAAGELAGTYLGRAVKAERERDAAEKARRDQLEISKFVDEDFMRMVGARAHDSRQMHELQDRLRVVESERDDRGRRAIDALRADLLVQNVCLGRDRDLYREHVRNAEDEIAKLRAVLEAERADWTVARAAALGDIDRSLAGGEAWVLAALTAAARGWISRRLWLQPGAPW